MTAPQNHTWAISQRCALAAEVHRLLDGDTSSRAADLRRLSTDVLGAFPKRGESNLEVLRDDPWADGSGPR